VAWFAVRFDTRTFAIFDAFNDEAARDAHLAGRVAAALLARAGELLAQAPEIRKSVVLADRLPSVG
jgi:quinol monooxygenase YgiN